MKTAVFGDPAAYTLWDFANRLNGGVRVSILHAGQGTLWTDLEKAALGELGGAEVLKGLSLPPAVGSESPRGR